MGQKGIQQGENKKERKMTKNSKNLPQKPLRSLFGLKIARYQKNTFLKRTFKRLEKARKRFLYT